MLKLTMGDLLGLTCTTVIFSLIVIFAFNQTTNKNPIKTAQKVFSSACYCDEGRVVM